MAITIPDNAELKFLNLILKSESFTLHLYKNSLTVSGSISTSDLVECNFTNYTSILLDKNTWTIEIIDEIAVGTYPQQTWVCGLTGNIIAGSFILDGLGNLMWLEPFSGVVLANGDTLKYTPEIRLDSVK